MLTPPPLSRRPRTPAAASGRVRLGSAAVTRPRAPPSTKSAAAVPSRSRAAPGAPWAASARAGPLSVGAGPPDAGGGEGRKRVAAAGAGSGSLRLALAFALCVQRTGLFAGPGRGGESWAFWVLPQSPQCSSAVGLGRAPAGSVGGQSDSLSRPPVLRQASRCFLPCLILAVKVPRAWVAARECLEVSGACGWRCWPSSASPFLGP